MHNKFNIYNNTVKRCFRKKNGFTYYVQARKNSDFISSSDGMGFIDYNNIIFIYLIINIFIIIYDFFK